MGNKEGRRQMLLLLLAEAPLHQTHELLANLVVRTYSLQYSKFVSNEKASLCFHFSSSGACICRGTRTRTKILRVPDFRNQNKGLSASGSTTQERRSWCVDPNKLFPRNTSDFYFQLRTICDEMKTAILNNEEVKHWVQDKTTISYISNHSCVNFTNGTVVPTTTCALKHYKNGYLHCKGIDAVYVPLATFALPPFLIAKSCNQNPLCVAFTVDKKGSTGTIFSAVQAPKRLLLSFQDHLV